MSARGAFCGHLEHLFWHYFRSLGRHWGRHFGLLLQIWQFWDPCGAFWGLDVRPGSVLRTSRGPFWVPFGPPLGPSGAHGGPGWPFGPNFIHSLAILESILEAFLASFLDNFSDLVVGGLLTRIWLHFGTVLGPSGTEKN